MGAGWQRWWRDCEAEMQAELDRYGLVSSRETIGNCTVTTYVSGRVTYHWEQDNQLLDVGPPRYFAYNPTTGEIREVKRNG